MTEDLSEPSIRAGLPEELSGLALRLFQTIDSTNSFAKRVAKKDGSRTEVILSDTQREGRGRREHTWESPGGVGLYISIISRPRIKNSLLPAVNLAAGIAAAKAIYQETGIKVSLKWPNDLVKDRKKLGGILLEKGRNGALVTGLGLNINNEESDFPEEIKERATSLFLCSGIKYDRNRVASSFITLFDFWCRLLEASPEKVIDTWKELSSTIGRKVTVSEGGNRLEGTATDVDELGFLLLEDEAGKIIKIASGEICCSQST